MSDTVVVLADPSSPQNTIILVEQTQGPAGGGPLSVTGTGFIHVTAGALDPAARAVSLTTTDVVAPTGTGFVHDTGGTLDAASRAVNLASADVTGVTPVANGGTNLNATGTAGQILYVVSAGVLGYENLPASSFTVNQVNHASGAVVMAIRNDYWCDPSGGSVAITTPTGAALGDWFCLKILGSPSAGSPVTITVAGGGSKGLEIPIGEGATAPVTLNTFTTTTLAFTLATDEGAAYVWVSDGANNWQLRS